MLQGIISGVVWFSVFLIAHIVMFHFVHVRDAFKWLAKSFGVCIVAHASTMAVLGLKALSVDIMILNGFYGALAMLCLFILYMPFYYTIVASLSIQSLICLQEAPLKFLPLSELRRRFASREIVAGRLKTMAVNGYLEPVGEGYRLTAKARMMSDIFAFLKDLWKLGPGG